MKENIVLQVILHDGEGLEIRVGDETKINPLMLVGILEQVKLNILNTGTMTQDMGEAPVSKTTYDA